MMPASQRFFLHSCIYLLILIISYLATCQVGTYSLSVLMCHKAVNQSINRLLVRHSAIAGHVQAYGDIKYEQNIGMT